MEEQDTKQPKTFEPVDLASPCDDQLNGIIAKLTLKDSVDSAKAKHHLAAHVRAYSLARLVNQAYPTIHEDARTMRRISDSFDNILSDLKTLSPQVSVGLAIGLSEKLEKDEALHILKSDIESLRQIANHFDEAKFKRKQPNEVLFYAVGGLMLVLQSMTGNLAGVRQRNSDTGTLPALNSAEAEVIGRLLRIANPELQDTTLVNVITKIRREADKNGLSRFEHKTLLGGKIQYQTDR